MGSISANCSFRDFRYFASCLLRLPTRGLDANYFVPYTPIPVLLAGVVINLVEFVTHGVILKDAWEQAMQALGMGTAFSAKGNCHLQHRWFLARHRLDVD